MSERTPTESDLRQAYVEASGATVAQESYYAEQVAEFERGIARIKAEAWDEGALAGAADQDAWDGWRYYPSDKHPIPNPYREEAGL